MNLLRIIIIEDDLLARIALEQKLKALGYLITLAASSEEAKAKIKNVKFDLAFVDLDLDRKLEGLSLLPKLQENGIYSIVLSGREEDEVIAECYRRGCNDYLAKPISQHNLLVTLRKFQQKNSKESLKEILASKFHTKNNKFLEQVKVISNSLLSDRPILIQGETGTGKTFLAKLIHQLSGDNLPFVQVNCSEFTESLLESELFGHEKGAFTGAIKTKKGLLELANDGILFLDEISTMSVSLQKKLLKALEEKEFYSVGGEKKIKSNFRLISATCEDLAHKIIKGEFRQDLYFRIEGFNINLPALRTRTDDIEDLIKYFVKKESRRFVLDTTAMEELKKYFWPGNVRELEKVIEVLRASELGIINKADLHSLVKLEAHKIESWNIDYDKIKSVGLNNYVANLEMEIVQQVFKTNEEKVRKTLNDLKLSNNSFYRIMDNIKKSESGNVR